MKNRILSLSVFCLLIGLVAANQGCKKDDNPASPAADKWFALPPLNDDVSAMTLFNGELIVGGSFTQASGVAVNRLASWNGSIWKDVGGGVSAGSQGITLVTALTVYNGKLIVAGHFNQTGTVSARSIAAWDGTNWFALGSGVDAYALANGPYALSVYRNNLIVGGSFSEAGGVQASDIAMWNGSSWAEFGGGLFGGYGVRSMVMYDTNLVVAGTFTRADTTRVSNIAMWNGTSWVALGTGLVGGSSCVVWSMTNYNGNLVAAGEFANAGGATAIRMASWNGSSWCACGSGLSGVGYTVTVFNGSVVAGGSFSTAGGNSAHCISRWNGNAWSPLGGGLSGGELWTWVQAMQVYDGKLFVGGNFTKAGDVAVGNIAGWQD